MRPGFRIRESGFVKGDGEAHASLYPDCIRDRLTIVILTDKRTVGRCKAAPLANPDSPIPALMR
ncbi:hypothetical protein XBLMG947_2969 [Xanthomonas bromi]|uniref:Uncharacterized protein n=1 Tax=Xanthomonas bromi TaxID=56449 RepID=A0A1C3NP46_9XANT|nr:hypothetical protein XBLMG947_2969 [Xanthomonas bromi]